VKSVMMTWWPRRANRGIVAFGGGSAADGLKSWPKTKLVAILDGEVQSLLWAIRRDPTVTPGKHPTSARKSQVRVQVSMLRSTVSVGRSAIQKWSKFFILSSFLFDPRYNTRSYSPILISPLYHQIFPLPKSTSFLIQKKRKHLFYSDSR